MSHAHRCLGQLERSTKNIIDWFHIFVRRSYNPMRKRHTFISILKRIAEARTHHLHSKGNIKLRRGGKPVQPSATPSASVAAVSTHSASQRVLGFDAGFGSMNPTQRMIMLFRGEMESKVSVASRCLSFKLLESCREALNAAAGERHS